MSEGLNMIWDAVDMISGKKNNVKAQTNDSESNEKVEERLETIEENQCLTK